MKEELGAAQVHGRWPQMPFLFATGIENSYPTILGPDGKTLRVDEMAKTGHY